MSQFSHKTPVEPIAVIYTADESHMPVSHIGLFLHLKPYILVIISNLSLNLLLLVSFVNSILCLSFSNNGVDVNQYTNI